MDTSKLLIFLLLFQLVYASLNFKQMLERRVKTLKRISKRLYGTYSGGHKVWNPEEEARFSYPRADKQKLSAMSHQWNTYYACCVRDLDTLSITGTLPASSVMSYAGSRASLQCGMCVAPGETREVAWYYSKSLYDLDFKTKVEKETAIIEPDRSLSIYNVQKADEGVYRCQINANVGGIVVLEVAEDDEYTLVKPATSHGPYALPPQKIQDLLLFTVWTEWSECSTCGQVGRKRRYGMCYMKAANAKKDIDAGYNKVKEEQSDTDKEGQNNNIMKEEDVITTETFKYIDEDEKTIAKNDLYNDDEINNKDDQNTKDFGSKDRQDTTNYDGQDKKDELRFKDSQDMTNDDISEINSQDTMDNDNIDIIIKLAADGVQGTSEWMDSQNYEIESNEGIDKNKCNNTNDIEANKDINENKYSADETVANQETGENKYNAAQIEENKDIDDNKYSTTDGITTPIEANKDFTSETTSTTEALDTEYDDDTDSIKVRVQVQRDSKPHREGNDYLRDFPNGVPCHSKYLPMSLRYVYKVLNRTNEIMIAMCKVPCQVKLYKKRHPNGEIEIANNSAGIYSLDQSPPRVLEPTRDIVFATRGRPIVIRCPGTTFRDIPISWRVGNRVVVPRELDVGSDGRVRIDGRDRIMFDKIWEEDGGLYSCWQAGILAGTIRLVVWRGTDSSGINIHMKLLMSVIAAFIVLRVLKRLLRQKRIKAGVLHTD